MTINTPFNVFIQEFNQRNKCSPFRLETKPFPFAVYHDVGCQLDSFFDCGPLLCYSERQTDLYHMYQTEEIGSPTRLKLVLKMFPNFIAQNFETTGIYLSSQIYESENYLLCHDDQLEDRLFAFVFYLHEKQDILSTDGGFLDLFDCNEILEPDHIALQVAPEVNSLVIFEVSPRSFHQVSEVINTQFKRRSVGGWVRGKYTFAKYLLECEQLAFYRSILNDDSSLSFKEFFESQRKYKLMKGSKYSENLPACYFYMDILLFDHTSFDRSFKYEADHFDYYVYALQDPSKRICGLDFESTSNCFFRSTRRENTANICIDPGEGNIYVLKCRKR